MSNEPEVHTTDTGPPDASQRLADPFTDSELEEAGQLAEDRRQREPDDGELAGEAPGPGASRDQRVGARFTASSSVGRRRSRRALGLLLAVRRAELDVVTMSVVDGVAG